MRPPSTPSVHPRRPLRATAIVAVLGMIASILGIATLATGVLATPASDGNPDLPQQCGIDMTLIIDRSGSIGDLNDEVADAANALVSGLAGTGSSVQVISFSREATALADGNGDGDNEDLADLSFVSADTLTVPTFASGGWTNWDDALEMARRSPAGVAPLTVLLTDGNPTAYNDGVPDGHGGTATDANDAGYVSAQSMIRAQQEADLLQLAGSHIFAVGVGSGINTANLSAIAGDEEYTSGGSVPFEEADWTQVGFAELATLFEDFVKDLCSPSVNINKTEVPLEGDPRPGDGWGFQIDLADAPGDSGGFWQNPAQADTESSASLVTVDGSANFKWEFGGPDDSTGLSIIEAGTPGWELTSVTCERRNFDDDSTVDLLVTPIVAADGSVSWLIPGGIGAGDAVNCDVVNTQLPPPGSITIVKNAIGADGTFSFVSDFNGSFELSTVDGAASTAAIEVQPGTYSVAELDPAPWDLTGVVCSDGSAVDAIEVASDEAVICTFTNVAPDPSITITKTADPTSVPEPGATVTFTIGIVNTSIEPVTINAISDSVEGGTPFDVTALPVNTCAALIGTSLAASGEVGDSATCSYELFVAGNGGDTVTDVVTVAGEDDQGTPVDDDDDAVVDVTDVLPGVALTKSANVASVPEPGADVEFTFLVENTSAEPLTVTSLVDSVFGDITAECGWAGLGLAAADATIGSGPDSATCTITRFIGGNAGETHTNVATVTGEDDEGNDVTDDDDQDVDVTDVLPGVALTKSANVASVPEPGADVEFTFLVENTSAEPLTVTSLVDSVFGDITAECGWAGLGLAAADATIGSGPDSATCTITRFIGGNAGETHTNVATVTGEDDEGNDVTDDDDQDVDIADVDPTIDVVKTADPLIVPEPGANVTFVASVVNTSVEPVTIASVSDAIDGGTAFPVTAVGGPVLATTCDDAVGTQLAPGESYACDFVVYVSGNGGDVVTDVVEFTVEDDEGNEATDDDDADVEIDDLLPAISIVKTASRAWVPEPGDDVIFTFLIENEASEALILTSLVDSVFGDVTAECGLAGDVLAASDGTPGSGPDATECQITRFVGGNAGDTHINVATVTGEDDDGNVVAAEDDATVEVIDVTPTISATKNGTPSSVPEPGADVTFTASLVNTSEEPVTITGVTDSVEGGAPFDVTVVAGPVLATTCGDAVGTVLAPAASYSCEFVVFVAGNAGDNVTDTIRFTAEDDEGNDVDDSDDEDTDVTDVAPGIVVVKSAGVVSVAEPGDNVTFTLDITNPSVEAVTVTALTDSVEGGAPFDVTVVAGPVLATTCGDAVGTVLAPDASYSCEFTVFVGGNGGDTITDVATVAAEDDEGNEVTDDDDEDVDVVDVAPGVSVTKNASVSEVPEPGADVEFSFFIENTAAEALTITSLVDSVFGDIAAECAVVGLVLAPTDGVVGSGPDSVECTITRFVGGNAGDLHTNVVTVTGEDDEGNEVTDDDDEEVDVVDVLPTLMVTKAAGVSEVAEPGADVEFTFTVANPSVESVTITSLVDSVFGDIADECAVAGLVLAPGGEVECTITRFVGGNAGDLHTNVVTVTGEDDEGNEVSDDDDEEVDVIDELPTIDTTKTDDGAEVDAPGGVVTYTVTIENTSVEPVTVISFTDQIDGGAPIDVTVVGAPIEATTCALGTTIAAGATYTCSFDVRIVGDGSSSVFDTVDVVVADDEGNQASDEANEETPVNPIADLVLTKTTDATAVSAGDTVVYRLDVVNNGPSTATEVIVTDILPPGLTLVGATADVGWTCGEPAPDTVECRILALAPGDTGTITVTTEVEADAVGAIENLASVDSETPDPDLENNADVDEIVSTVVAPETETPDDDPVDEPAAPSPPLAFTGASVAGSLLLALVLLGLGFGLAGAARIRPGTGRP